MHHQFGDIIGDNDLGGILVPEHAVLVDSSTYLSLEGAGITENEGEMVDAMALKLVGRLINAPEDSIGVVFVMSLLDLGYMIGSALKLVEELKGEHSKEDFNIGVHNGYGEELSA